MKKGKQSLTVADVFINLGIKGTGSVVNGLVGVKNTVTDVAYQGFKATAAISGVVYGLEKLMSQAGHAGTALLQFNNLTGLSSDRLQRWAYLGLQAGVAADEMTSSIQGLQNNITKMLLGQGAPAGINAVKNLVGLDPTRFRDTFYILDKLREYAQKTKNTPDISNEILKSFGLSDKTIQALRTSRVDLEKIDKSRIYSSRQQQRLNSVNIGLSNVSDKFQHGVGDLTAAYGPQLVKDIDRVSTAVLGMVKAFGELNRVLPILSVISRVFEGWANIFDLIKEATDEITGKSKMSLLPSASGLKYLAKDLGSQVLGAAEGKVRSLTQGLLGAPPVPSGAAFAVPPMSHGAVSKTSNVNNNVTANVTVHGVHDAHEVPKHVNKMINDAARQLPQNGGF